MVDAKLKIVVAEDHAIQRRYMCSLIDKLGYEAIPAEDGIIALDLIKNKTAQILISDLNMPNLNGIELTQAIRQIGLDYYVHIIMVTGQDNELERNEALKAGVDDFLSKGQGSSSISTRIKVATRLIFHEKQLADRNKILSEANDKIENDLRAAAIAQRRLLPSLRDEILGCRISSAFVPSSIVSGDMFGCFPIGDDKLGFYAVDVSGHGVQASLLSVAIGHLITPEYFKNNISHPDGHNDPARMVAALNERFFDQETDEYFTMFCGILDKNTDKLDFCQAGYPSPFIRKPDNFVESVGDGGYPVGLIEKAVYENTSIPFGVGSTLIICSDAATEAININGIQFGIDRLKAVIENNYILNSEQIPGSIVGELSNWRKGETLDDDLTIVTFERNKINDPLN